MREFIAAFCLLLGACASTGQQLGGATERATTWRTVAFASAGVDVLTTFIGQQSGAREQNAVLGQQPTRIVAINAAVLGAVWWLSRDLEPGEQVTLWK